MTAIARTIWLEAPGRIAFREETLGEPGAGQLLCRTLVTAISPGTELAAYRGLPPLRPGAGAPRVMGYCNVAEVIAVGPATAGYAPGDRILTHASHRSHFLTGADDVLLTLDPAADADRIVTSYLFHLGYNAVLRSGVRPGDRMAVIGLGVLGLASVAFGALAGAEVTALSDHEAPRERALRLGAQVAMARAGVAAADLLDRQDVVVSTTNGWADWQLATGLAGQMGTIACLGFPGRGEELPQFNPLDSAQFYTKQLRIESVGLSPERRDARGFLRHNERDNLAFVARLIGSGSLDAGSLVSGRYPAGEIDAAYRALIAREGSPVTFLIDWP